MLPAGIGHDILPAHVHGVGCGHRLVVHHDHLDYLDEGKLHHQDAEGNWFQHFLLDDCTYGNALRCIALRYVALCVALSVALCVAFPYLSQMLRDIKRQFPRGVKRSLAIFADIHNQTMQQTFCSFLKRSQLR